MMIGYMRVSTDGGKQSTALQKEALLNAGVAEDNLYVDHVSGSQKERPGLNAALASLQKGDTLIVWKLDRLGRSLSHLVTLIEGLREKGIDFKSLTEKMDTSSHEGLLMFHIFGSLAQYERSLTRERVLAGLEAAKERGNRGGRPRRLDARTIEQIQILLKSGMTKTDICRNLSIARSTLYDALRIKKTTATIEG